MNTTITSQGESYDLTIGEIDGDPFCAIKLLPFETFLFRSSLEWLNYSGHLEDGDATHPVPREAIDEMIDVAKANNYPWEPI